MAASITSKLTTKYPVGDHYEQVFAVSFASVTSGTFTTADHGFRQILNATYIPDTSDDHGITKINSDGSSTVLGSVTISSVTSNDTGRMVIKGV